MLEFSSITKRLIFWFCGITAVSLVVFSSVIYFMRVEAIRAQELDKLSIIRDLKARELNTWIDIVSGDMATMASNPAVVRTAAVSGPRILTPDAAAGAEAVLSRFVINYNHYLEIFMMHAQSGIIVYSTDSKNAGLNESANEYFTEPLRTRGLHIKDIYYSERLDIHTMTFSRPVYSAEDRSRPTAVLVARIYLQRSIFTYLQDRTGLGESGSSIIVNSKGRVLNRPEINTANLSDGADEELIKLALAGEPGTADGIIFRGRGVMAAYTGISRTGWGLITMRSINEVYAPIRKLYSEMLFLLVLFIGIVSVAAYFLARSLAGPVRSLARTAMLIETGDLTARNYDIRGDEIGYLARSFNSMADSLVAELSFQRSCSELNEAMLSTIEPDRFAAVTLERLIGVTGSSFGAFYGTSDTGGGLILLAFSGIDSAYLGLLREELFEGEFARALSLRDIVHTRTGSLPESLTSKLKKGGPPPSEIITLPVISMDRTAALIVLGSMPTFTAKTLVLLRQARPVINTAFSNIMSMDRSIRLSDELVKKNRLLEANQQALEAKASELDLQTRMVRRQNRELERQRSIVETSNRLKSEFLSNMSHELRTPLNSILALSRILIMKNKKVLPDEHLGFLDIIQRNGNQLLTLINDILDLSKIESGRIEIKPETVSPASVIQLIAENLEQQAIDKGVTLTVEIPGDLPHIMSDENRLHQVFQNIIGNAVKFTEEGGVTVTALHEGGLVKVMVSDTGIGIEEAHLESIFDEFRQIDGTLTRKYEGTGLGLAIARKSLDLIGGRVTVDSVPGRGSVFTVALPVEWGIGNISASAENISEAPASPADDISAGVMPGYKSAPAVEGELKSVLVIEDDPDNMVTVNALLRDEFRIIMAYSGRDGLDLMKTERPSMVLLDMALPDISGFEVVKEIKRDPALREIPVIAITALSMSGDRERILNAGCDDYISKPFNIDRFFETVRKWAELSG
jgi:signal transduction histidine kinase